MRWKCLSLLKQHSMRLRALLDFEVVGFSWIAGNDGGGADVGDECPPVASISDPVTGARRRGAAPFTGAGFGRTRALQLSEARRHGTASGSATQVVVDRRWFAPRAWRWPLPSRRRLGQPRRRHQRQTPCSPSYSTTASGARSPGGSGGSGSLDTRSRTPSCQLVPRHCQAAPRPSSRKQPRSCSPSIGCLESAARAPPPAHAPTPRIPPALICQSLICD